MQHTDNYLRKAMVALIWCDLLFMYSTFARLVKLVI